MRTGTTPSCVCPPPCPVWEEPYPTWVPRDSASNPNCKCCGCFTGWGWSGYCGCLHQKGLFTLSISDVFIMSLAISLQFVADRFPVQPQIDLGASALTLIPSVNEPENLSKIQSFSEPQNPVKITLMFKF